MATDWAEDVKKYVPNADDGIIAGIVRYCGIALRNRDSSLVSFSDKKETDRVRENFLKKKLALTESDSVLDAAIAKVGEMMKADRTKNRVTVYYLLADNFNKLSLFAAKAKAGTKSAGTAAPAAALAGAAGLAATKAPAKKKTPAKKKAAPAKKAPARLSSTKIKTAAAEPQGLLEKAAGAGTAAAVGTVAAAGALAASAAGTVKDTAAKAVDSVGDAAGAVAGVAGAAAAGAAGLAAGAADKAGAAVSQLTGAVDDEDSGLGWLWWVLGLALLLFAAWWLFLRGSGDEAAPPASAATEAAASAPTVSAPADLAAAPAEGTIAIPAGAGVTSELRDGKPVVKVYFDSGKTEVVPDFATAAGGLKAWLDANPGSSLQVSGFNDPTGSAARNEALARGRAEQVGAALVAAGIAQTSVELVKPQAATDTSTNLAGARRVEVTVK